MEIIVAVIIYLVVGSIFAWAKAGTIGIDRLLVSEWELFAVLSVSGLLWPILLLRAIFYKLLQ